MLASPGLVAGLCSPKPFVHCLLWCLKLARLTNSTLPPVQKGAIRKDAGSGELRPLNT